MSRRSTRNMAGPGEGIGAQSVQTHLIPSVTATPASSSLYLQNYYSHPASTRLLLGNIAQNGGKVYRGVGGAVPKPPKPPEKPLMPYMRYSRKVWDDVKAGNTDLKLWEIGKIIGQMWRELPSSDKQQYVEEYEVEKMEHVEQLRLYHNSPAYQAYLHAKTRAEAMEASAEALGGDKDDAYMSIEPTDETADNSDMCFSVKHVAAARFQRNHRLINDILGEAIHVPSTRAVVTTQRLNVLKNQVHSLELHQKKLEAELVLLEDAHSQKKRKWVAQAREFGQEMKRLREITPQEYYKEYKLKQQQSAAAQQKLQEEAKAEKEAKEKAEAKKKAEDAKKESGDLEKSEEKAGSASKEAGEESNSKKDSVEEKDGEPQDESEKEKEEGMEVEELDLKTNEESTSASEEVAEEDKTEESATEDIGKIVHVDDSTAFEEDATQKDNEEMKEAKTGDSVSDEALEKEENAGKN